MEWHSDDAVKNVHNTRPSPASGGRCILEGKLQFPPIAQEPGSLDGKIK